VNPRKKSLFKEKDRVVKLNQEKKKAKIKIQESEN
jgi:hypothetical protein